MTQQSAGTYWVEIDGMPSTWCKTWSTTHGHFRLTSLRLGHLYRNDRGTVGGSAGGAECRGGARTTDARTTDARTTDARTTGITESHQASRKDTRALQEARQAVKETQGVNQGINKLGQQRQMNAAVAL